MRFQSGSIVNTTNGADKGYRGASSSVTMPEERSSFRSCSQLWKTTRYSGRAKLWPGARMSDTDVSDERVRSAAMAGELQGSGSATHAGHQRNWFAVFTRSHHEKSVAEHLRER